MLTSEFGVARYKPDNKRRRPNFTLGGQRDLDTLDEMARAWAGNRTERGPARRARFSRVTRPCAGERRCGNRRRYDVAAIMRVMLSPLSRMRPSAFRVFFLIESSSASSRTRFMYSARGTRRTLAKVCLARAHKEGLRSNGAQARAGWKLVADGAHRQSQ